MNTNIVCTIITVMFTKQDFFAPSLSTTCPITKAPQISPTPKATIASMESSNCSFLPLSSIVSVMIGTSIPVYTEILIPVHANYGMTGRNRFDTSNVMTPRISCLKACISEE